MSFEYHRNTFEGGVNKSLSPANFHPNEVTDAKNVLLSDIVGNNKFTALENIKGTTHVIDIVTAGAGDIDIFAVFNTRYKVGNDLNLEGLTIFSRQGSVFRIQAYIHSTNTLYLMYEENLGVDYSTNQYAVDGVKYSEFGKDILYFTDQATSVKKLICEIPLPYSPDFLTTNDLALAKRGAIGLLQLSQVTTGGSLLTGTYQLAYQLINPTSNKYTKFSLLTTPIHVYGEVGGIVRAGVGLPSNKKIVVNITPTAEELAYFTHFRLAVVENIYPKGVNAAIVNEIGLTQVEAISTYLVGSVITNYSITSNIQTESVPIDDIVIDLAAIETVGTLTTKDSRLLFGNVTLNELDYDNGNPVISSGSILVQTNSGWADGDGFASDDFTSKYKGHFRDEVYRYAISYFDAEGNYSSPYTLNLSSVTNNAISGGLTDMKYPSRKTDGYRLMDVGNKIQSLGLRLVGINNHPKWARGFVILRAKRKKNILFQTPLLPMARYDGIGAVDNYPTVTREGSPPANVTYEDATPMGPSSVMIPYNMFHGAPAASYPPATLDSGAGNNKIRVGEARALSYDSIYTHALMYPPVNMYGEEDFIFAGNESLVTADASICRLYATRFDSESYNPGWGTNTSIAGTFFSSLNNDYYYYSGAGVRADIRAASSDDNAAIAAHRSFDNYTPGVVVDGTYVWDYSKLETPGITLGYPGNTHRSVVVSLTRSRNCVAGTGGFGTPVTFASGVPVFSPHTGGVLQNNGYLVTATGLFASYCNVIEIVNVQSGLQDSRYGASSNFNEFIFTGSKYVFNAGELVTVAAGGSLPKDIDVWGGDCVVSPHLFKVADTAYSILNQSKALGSGNSADGVIDPLFPYVPRSWANNAGSAVMVPFGVKNASQYLQIVLESEYHGSVRDVDSYTTVTTQNFKIFGCNSESKARSPLTYGYNINLNKENDQKIFVPLDPLAPAIFKLPSRIYYSDVKIYQSTIEGFDIIRVGNFMDLQERYGAITKLAINADSLIAIQEDAVSYIPVGEKVLEETDASTIGVRSGDFLSTPLILDSRRGGQHLLGVCETGNELFILDNRRRDIYKLGGDKSLSSISAQKFASEVNLYYKNTIAPNQLRTWYDFTRNHLWIVDKQNSTCWIYNNRLSLWECSALQFSDMPEAGLSSFTTKDLVLFGVQASNNMCVLATMYTGPRTLLFGTTVTPSVSFLVNPQPEFSKTFDNLLLLSTNRLTSATITVPQEEGITDLTTGAQSLNVTTRGEGNYRVKTIRDTITNQRMRGTYAIVDLVWPSGLSVNESSLLSTVVTQYRPSAKIY